MSLHEHIFAFCWFIADQKIPVVVIGQKLSAVAAVSFSLVVTNENLQVLRSFTCGERKNEECSMLRHAYARLIALLLLQMLVLQSEKKKQNCWFQKVKFE